MRTQKTENFEKKHTKWAKIFKILEALKTNLLFFLFFLISEPWQNGRYTPKIKVKVCRELFIFFICFPQSKVYK